MKAEWAVTIATSPPHPTPPHPKLFHRTTNASSMKGGKFRQHPDEQENLQSLVSTSLVLKQQEQYIKCVLKKLH